MCGCGCGCGFVVNVLHRRQFRECNKSTGIVEHAIQKNEEQNGLSHFGIAGLSYVIIIIIRGWSFVGFQGIFCCRYSGVIGLI